MLDIILFLLGGFIGMMVGSFTMIPILIMLRFGISFTRELEKKRWIKQGNNVVRNYFFSIALLSFLYYIVYRITGALSLDLQWGLVFGTIYALFFGFSKTGKNDANIQDYLKTNDAKLTSSTNE